MVVRLRFARHGTKNNPFYHIVAIQNTKARDARPIEKLGEYDPVPRPARPISPAHFGSSNRPGHNGEIITPGIKTDVRLEKRLEWNEERIRYWLGTGAQPSKPVARLLDRVSVKHCVATCDIDYEQAGLIPPEKRFLYKGLFRAPSIAAGEHAENMSKE